MYKINFEQTMLTLVKT